MMMMLLGKRCGGGVDGTFSGDADPRSPPRPGFLWPRYALWHRGSQRLMWWSSVAENWCCWTSYCLNWGTCTHPFKCLSLERYSTLTYNSLLSSFRVTLLCVHNPTFCFIVLLTLTLERTATRYEGYRKYNTISSQSFHGKAWL